MSPLCQASTCSANKTNPRATKGDFEMIIHDSPQNPSTAANCVGSDLAVDGLDGSLSLLRDAVCRSRGALAGTVRSRRAAAMTTMVSTSYWFCFSPFSLHENQFCGVRNRWSALLSSVASAIKHENCRPLARLVSHSCSDTQHMKPAFPWPRCSSAVSKRFRPRSSRKLVSLTLPGSWA